MALKLVYLVPALMILTQVVKIQESTYISSSVSTTTVIEIIYALLGIYSVGILVITPWLMPLHHSRNFDHDSKKLSDVSPEIQSRFLLSNFWDSIRVFGWCCVLSWCLLQLLLQQPVNSMPVSLLLVQILASVHYFLYGGGNVKQWVKVAAFYYMGMSGHFSFGNTNTLATIDVAGAFIGISSHSTVISGILMFIITYASPLIYLLSRLISVFDKDISRTCINGRDINFGHLLKRTLGNPCLVLLGLNSIILFAYTVVLLLMRNHLFVWSVFSPKYLYVGATMACVYIGVSIVALTAIYTCMVFAARRKLKGLV